MREIRSGLHAGACPGAARTVEAAGEVDEHGRAGGAPRTGHLAAAVRLQAASRSPLLVRGEPGTGKELVARAVHRSGPRAGGRFVPVDCAALPPHLAAEEIFGRGGSQARKGRFEIAAGGTIFLGSVTALPPAVQERLLRALVEDVGERAGSGERIAVGARVICGTSRSLRDEAAAGRFVGALAARLAEAELEVPPLRERIEDLPRLVEEILGDEAARARRRGRPDAAGRLLAAPRTLALLAAHAWPGNLAELRRTLWHALRLSPDGVILPEHLPARLRDPAVVSLGLARRGAVALTLAGQGPTFLVKTVGGKPGAGPEVA